MCLEKGSALFHLLLPRQQVAVTVVLESYGLLGMQPDLLDQDIGMWLIVPRLVWNNVSTCGKLTPLWCINLTVVSILVICESNLAIKEVGVEAI